MSIVGRGSVTLRSHNFVPIHFIGASSLSRAEQPHCAKCEQGARAAVHPLPLSWLAAPPACGKRWYSGQGEASAPKHMCALRWGAMVIFRTRLCKERPEEAITVLFHGSRPCVLWGKWIVVLPVSSDMVSRLTTPLCSMLHQIEMVEILELQ